MENVKWRNIKKICTSSNENLNLTECSKNWAYMEGLLGVQILVHLAALASSPADVNWGSSRSIPRSWVGRFGSEHFRSDSWAQQGPERLLLVRTERLLRILRGQSFDDWNTVSRPQQVVCLKSAGFQFRGRMPYNSLLIKILNRPWQHSSWTKHSHP